MDILRNNDVCEKLGISPTTLWRWVRDESFPAPIKMGLNSVGWLQSEVDDWIVEKAQSRGGV